MSSRTHQRIGVLVAMTSTVVGIGLLAGPGRASADQIPTPVQGVVIPTTAQDFWMTEVGFEVCVTYLSTSNTYLGRTPGMCAVPPPGSPLI